MRNLGFARIYLHRKWLIFKSQQSQIRISWMNTELYQRLRRQNILTSKLLNQLERINNLHTLPTFHIPHSNLSITRTSQQSIFTDQIHCHNEPFMPYKFLHQTQTLQPMHLHTFPCTATDNQPAVLSHHQAGYPVVPMRMLKYFQALTLRVLPDLNRWSRVSRSQQFVVRAEWKR